MFAPLYNISFSAASSGPETLIGIVGKDFVLLGADSSISSSIALTCTNMDKIYPIGGIFPPKQEQQQQQQQQSTILAAAAGENADVHRMIQHALVEATICEYESSLGHDVEYICIKIRE